MRGVGVTGGCQQGALVGASGPACYLVPGSASSRCSPAADPGAQRSRAATSAACASPQAPPGDNMPTAKQLADIGYKTFSSSMILLTVYGGYLCSARAYRYFQRQSSQRQAAEEQKTSGAL
ncbi:uncharacterized protein LOC126022653 isoform X1 [Suncus etruscus]|uniref:uncharacterized protein LOC126022653 isoform X1 n=1 Tax=Suncus etruscus TaxID=109475 RepID=UPI00211099F4|nr:uncharacterized protein LOC126022653 isoform X1 [Suncus etruscus]